jgi:hypothetical protein
MRVCQERQREYQDGDRSDEPCPRQDSPQAIANAAYRFVKLHVAMNGEMHAL